MKSNAATNVHVLLQFDTIESDFVFNTATKWIETCQSRYEHRRYVAFVLDTFGRTVLVTRYLKELQPPVEIQSAAQSNVKTAAVRRDVQITRQHISCRISPVALCR